MEKPTHADIWHRLGRLDEKLDTMAADVAEVKKFSDGYKADRNRILGVLAGISLVAALVVSGFKAWVISWFPGASS